MSMRKVLLLTLVLVLVFSNLAFAAPSEAEAVDSFKEYVRAEVNKALATYEAKNQQIFELNKRKPPVWKRIHYTLSPDYTIDLRKNDSLINPYIGKLEIAKISYHEEFATQEEAEKCTSPKNKDTDRYIFILAYQDEKWVVTNVVLEYSGEVKLMGIYDKLKNKYW
ncbi:hypothetical protein SATMO3_06140 [Sporomusa aerivorans]